MASRFGAAGGEHFSSEGGGEDMYPYVSFTINVEGWHLTVVADCNAFAVLFGFCSLAHFA